jgi:Skp family chaperone for outer membrane proteins
VPWVAEVARVLVALLAPILVAAGTPPGVWAAEGPAAIKVGIFDAQRVAQAIDPDAKTQTDAGKVKAKGKISREPVRPADPLAGNAEADRVRGEIRRLTDELDRVGNTLSTEEREKREEEIRTLQKRFMAIRASVLKGAKKEVQTLEQRALGLVTEYAQQHGFAILFERGYWSQEDVQRAIVLPAGAVDVTDDIVRWLKAKPPEALAEGKARPTFRAGGAGKGAGGGGGGGKGTGGGGHQH